jgi:hypothetical protein
MRNGTANVATSACDQCHFLIRLESCHAFLLLLLN